jgi:glucosyl-dolichyl phosphate glucuronosyltransferase
MSDSTRVTVILCTYNRAGSLVETLISLAATELASSIDWDVLVVDNNSSDGTRTVVEEFCQRYPDRFRYMFEPQQGKSYALNAAIREAKGDILAFVDDDETVSKDWLSNLTSGLVGGEWAGAGGRILPKWNCQRPQWCSADSAFTLAPLAVFDIGLAPGPLNEPPFGANMAYRREVFDRHGVFRTDLGRSGRNTISNEDTEFGRRVIAAGLRLRYEPLALTYHVVEENRIQKTYFLGWWFNKGRSDVRELGTAVERGRLVGIPPKLFRVLVWTTGRWIVTMKTSVRFIRKLEVWNCAGQIYEFYQQRRNAGQNWPRVKGGG